MIIIGCAGGRRPGCRRGPHGLRSRGVPWTKTAETNNNNNDSTHHTNDDDDNNDDDT